MRGLQRLPGRRDRHEAFPWQACARVRGMVELTLCRNPCVPADPDMPRHACGKLTATAHSVRDLTGVLLQALTVFCDSETC